MDGRSIPFARVASLGVMMPMMSVVTAPFIASLERPHAPRATRGRIVRAEIGTDDGESVAI